MLNTCDIIKWSSDQFFGGLPHHWKMNAEHITKSSCECAFFTWENAHRFSHERLALRATMPRDRELQRPLHEKGNRPFDLPLEDPAHLSMICPSVSGLNLQSHMNMCHWLWFSGILRNLECVPKFQNCPTNNLFDPFHNDLEVACEL